MTVKKITVKFKHLERDWNLINRGKKNYFELSGRIQFHSPQSTYTCNNEVIVLPRWPWGGVPLYTQAIPRFISKEPNCNLLKSVLIAFVGE